MLDQSIREYIWLRGSHATTSPKELTDRELKTKRDKFVLFQFGLAPCFLNRSFQIIRRPPLLVPLFPVGNYTPSPDVHIADQSSVVRLFAA